MKLNPDCIRDILLTVEDNSTIDSGIQYPDDSLELLSKYEPDEVLYHIKQCELSYLVTKVERFVGGSCYILDLSPSGHEFLANIRSDNNWNKTKSIAKTVGSQSLSAIKDIATGVISELIKSQFN